MEPSLCANVIKFYIRDTVMKGRGVDVCLPPRSGVTTRIPIIPHPAAVQWTRWRASAMCNVCCGNFITILGDEKQNQVTMNLQLHVAIIFSALHFIRNKWASMELFLAQSFNLLSALHVDKGSILPTFFALFTLSLAKHYNNIVIGNTDSYPRWPYSTHRLETVYPHGMSMFYFSLPSV
jgi:hypothetical protein